MVHLLDVDHVSKSFGGLLAVKDLSLYVDSGDTLGLIGPNGAGKTTLFNIITGVYRPDTGSVSFRGEKITSLRTHRIAKLGIARTFQIVRPFPRMSVLENVMAAAIFGNGDSSGRDVRDKAMGLISEMSLEKKADAKAGLLTLSEQRRLELARALATGPQLLMLDEVMAGLTQTEIQGMIDLLQRIRKGMGMTFVITEHVMRAIVQMCNRIVVMNQGEKLAEGTPDEVMKDKGVVAAYMGGRKTIPEN